MFFNSLQEENQQVCDYTARRVKKRRGFLMSPDQPACFQRGDLYRSSWSRQRSNRISPDQSGLPDGIYFCGSNAILYLRSTRTDQAVGSLLMRSIFNPGCPELDARKLSVFASFFRRAASDWNASMSLRNFLLGVRFGILHIRDKPCGKFARTAPPAFLKFFAACIADFYIAVN